MRCSSGIIFIVKLKISEVIELTIIISQSICPASQFSLQQHCQEMSFMEYHDHQVLDRGIGECGGKISIQQNKKAI